MSADKYFDWVVYLVDGREVQTSGVLYTIENELYLRSTDGQENFWAPKSAVLAIVREGTPTAESEPESKPAMKVGTLKIEAGSVHKGHGCRCA